MTNKQNELVKVVKRNLKLKFYLFKQDKTPNNNTGFSSQTLRGFISNANVLYFSVGDDPIVYAGIWNKNQGINPDLPLVGSRYINAYIRLSHCIGIASNEIDFTESNKDLIIVNGSSIIDDDFNSIDFLNFNPLIKVQIPKSEYKKGISNIECFIDINILGGSITNGYTNVYGPTYGNGFGGSL